MFYEFTLSTNPSFAPQHNVEDSYIYVDVYHETLGVATIEV